VSASKGPLLDEVRRRRGELYDLCASLIRIQNPPGDTSALVAFVTDYLTARGRFFRREGILDYLGGR